MAVCNIANTCDTGPECCHENNNKIALFFSLMIYCIYGKHPIKITLKMNLTFDSLYALKSKQGNKLPRYYIFKRVESLYTECL